MRFEKGWFYPFHRLMLFVYERELRSCGYDGAHPYWDWTLDATSPSAFLASPLFDKEAGFGGNGGWIPGNITNPASGMDVFVERNLPDRSGEDASRTDRSADLRQT